MIVTQSYKLKPESSHSVGKEDVFHACERAISVETVDRTIAVALVEGVIIQQSRDRPPSQPQLPSTTASIDTQSPVKPPNQTVSTVDTQSQCCCIFFTSYIHVPVQTCKYRQVYARTSCLSLTKGLHAGF